MGTHPIFESDFDCLTESFVMSICRRSAQWGLFTRSWYLLNCERQPLETVTKIAVQALSGRKKMVSGPDVGDHIVLYNTRRIALEGNMWEEHMYHFKSDWSQKKMKNRSQAPRGYNLNRNYFLSAEDAHAFDPTYVVRESIYRTLESLENKGFDKTHDIAMGRLNTFADDDVPQEMIENISNVIELPVAKKLSDYSEDEIENFPQIANENSEARLYDADVKARYNHVMTMLERAGPEGSLQEQEFMKDMNFEEFITRPGEITDPRPRRMKYRKSRFT